MLHPCTTTELLSSTPSLLLCGCLSYTSSALSNGVRQGRGGETRKAERKKEGTRKERKEERMGMERERWGDERGQGGRRDGVRVKRGREGRGGRDGEGGKEGTGETLDGWRKGRQGELKSVVLVHWVSRAGWDGTLAWWPPKSLCAPQPPLEEDRVGEAKPTSGPHGGPGPSPPCLSQRSMGTGAPSGPDHHPRLSSR